MRHDLWTSRLFSSPKKNRPTLCLAFVHAAFTFCLALLQHSVRSKWFQLTLEYWGSSEQNVYSQSGGNQFESRPNRAKVTVSRIFSNFTRIQAQIIKQSKHHLLPDQSWVKMEHPYFPCTPQSQWNGRVSSFLLKQNTLQVCFIYRPILYRSSLIWNVFSKK